MNNNNYVLILAGGVGSRFWPKSRKHFPKQFIDILGIGKSLLQLTYERFLHICPAKNIYILSNKEYKDLIKNQLPDLSDKELLLEPSQNNTAPCIAYASYKILKSNPDANIVVVPSDHLIIKENIFLSKIEEALKYAASNDALITLGIQPTRPDTGYGYISYKHDKDIDIYSVLEFIEKPVLETAREFVASGCYLWNAGIFIWAAKSIKKAFKQYAPKIDALFEAGNSFYNTDEETNFIFNNYPNTENISIDYAILEKADNVYTIPADIGWSDLGTWASLHNVTNKDEDNNALNCDKLSLDRTRGCIIHLPKGKVAVIKGLKDYIIVDDGNVLLIYPKGDEQEIKSVATKIADEFGEQYQ